MLQNAAQQVFPPGSLELYSHLIFLPNLHFPPLGTDIAEGYVPVLGVLRVLSLG